MPNAALVVRRVCDINTTILHLPRRINMYSDAHFIRREN